MSVEQNVPTSDAMEPRVPLAEYSARVSVPMVPFGPAGVTEQAASADYFDSAARNIAGGYAVGGYNVTSTVVALLHRTADALRAPEVRALPDREAIARAIDPDAWARWDSTLFESMDWRESLEKADAVLALFGQEGQR